MPSLPGKKTGIISLIILSIHWNSEESFTLQIQSKISTGGLENIQKQSLSSQMKMQHQNQFIYQLKI
mgnify:CR=1 FL=1